MQMFRATLLASTRQAEAPHTSGGTKKHTVVCPYRGPQLGNGKAAGMATHGNVDECQMRFAKGKKPFI